MNNVSERVVIPKRRLVWCGVRKPRRASEQPRKVFAGRIDGAVLVIRHVPSVPTTPRAA